MNAASVAISAPQHMQALERANRVRLARAALKRKVAAGLVGVPDVILNCPWEAESMNLSELLMSQRRWGRTRCRKFLVPLNLNENKQLGTLTERQRLLLAAALQAKTASTRSREGAAQAVLVAA